MHVVKVLWNVCTKWHILPVFKTNLALQGHSRVHPRSGRWLGAMGFGWGVVVVIRAGASLETKQRAMQRMVIFKLYFTK